MRGVVMHGPGDVRVEERVGQGGELVYPVLRPTTRSAAHGTTTERFRSCLRRPSGFRQAAGRRRADRPAAPTEAASLRQSRG
jgi:hypothetical protein